jgi:hypothetical protein
VPLVLQSLHDGLGVALGLELTRCEPPADDAVVEGEIEVAVVDRDVVGAPGPNDARSSILPSPSRSRNAVTPPRRNPPVVAA